ncbi:MAG: ribonuclease III [Thermodesulfobacteriota bacterium]
MKTDLNLLQQSLDYRFKNPHLLLEALRHSSYTHEQSGKKLHDNERLEFLGDAVLNLVIGHLLMMRFSELNEGDLSRIRSSLVNESQLARFADTLDLGSFLYLGKGEVQTHGRSKPSILADALEAVIAAVYLDGGFEMVFRLVKNHFSPQLEKMLLPSDLHDFKTQLQEKAQSAREKKPQYTVLFQDGPDHDKTFCVEVKVFGLSAQGVGKSKKAAEQEAAKHALELIRKNLSEDSVNTGETDISSKPLSR